ncbi:hypothetical protein V6N13_046374 [Hibiscus sabdariffa]
MSEPSRWVHEVSTVSVENKLDQLTNVVNSLVTGKGHSVKACGICTMTDHPTDYCPSLQDENVNAVGNFPGPPQRPYNPYSSIYNPGWRDHPNLSNAPNSTYQPRPPPSQPYQPPHKPSLETLMERFVQSQEQYQNQFDSRIQELEKQMSQLAQTVGRLESRGKLPSQTETNPKENVSAITLRGGTIIEPSIQEHKEAKKPTNLDSQEKDDATTKEGSPTPEPEHSLYAEPPPFPSRFLKKDKHAEEKEVLNVFQKVAINLSLLEVIRKMPRYAPFLKDLCAIKRKFSGHEKVNLGEYVSAILTRRFPLKFKDQGMFSIPRKIQKVSLKEVLSWTKRKRWMKLQCL